MLEPIMPMTYNWRTLKTDIAAMQSTGGTDQAIGLAWAWQTLLQTGPVPAPAEDSNATYNRVASSNGKADPSKFFLLTNANQTVTTFNTIGTALSELRVAR